MRELLLIGKRTGARVVTLLDDEDYERFKGERWIPHWKLNTNSYYAVRYSGGKAIYLAREIMSAVLGRQLLPGEQVDHIDHITLNNRRDNLRIVSGQLNNRNRSKCLQSTSSSYKGVSWNKKRRKWRAKIQDGEIRANGQATPRHLGYFTSEIEAALAYDKAARQSFGEYAALNFALPGEVSALRSNNHANPLGSYPQAWCQYPVERRLWPFPIP